MADIKQIMEMLKKIMATLDEIYHAIFDNKDNNNNK